MSVWPDGRPSAISVGFDNFGEASEIQMGLRSPDEPRGGHYSVTTCLPIVLEELERADIAATFFVEAINAETYPDELRAIAAAGHEIAFHAWCHEEWGALDAQAEADIIARSVQALRSLGIELRGFRPPGGLVGGETFRLLAEHDITYCSPAGSAAGVDEVVVLPFEWQNVDVFHVLPQFAALRTAITGDDEPGGPEAVEQFMLRALERPRGHLTLGLHTWMAEAERPQLRTILERVNDSDAWVARHDEVAQWMLEHREGFSAAPVLDERSWMSELD